MTLIHRRPSRRPGLTPAGLALVIAIVGMVAALGVPRLIRRVERSVAAEALDYLSAVQSAQDRHQARASTFAARLSDLDISAEPPGPFVVPEAFAPGATGSLESSWTMTLTRAGAPAGYGAYTVVFRESGFDAAASTVTRVFADSDLDLKSR